MTATAIAGMKLIVRDAEALERFYATALGLRRVHRLDQGEGADAFIEIIMAPAGSSAGPQLILMQYVNRPVPATGEVVAVLMTDDVEAAVAAVEDAGGTVTIPIMAVPEYRLRLAYVADPEGHAVELLQTVPA